jgi:hypothetical protein
MQKVQLSVLRMDGDWRLLIDGQGLGRFARRSAAVACAAEIARLSEQDGVRVELLAQTDFGELVALTGLV